MTKYKGTEEDGMGGGEEDGMGGAEEEDGDRGGQIGWGQGRTE